MSRLMFSWSNTLSFEYLLSTVTIACKIKVQSGIADIFLSQGKDQQQNLSAGLNCSLSHSFADLYNKALLSDVILKAGDCQVHAHRVILATQSPSFKAMFQVQLLAKDKLPGHISAVVSSLLLKQT